MLVLPSQTPGILERTGLSRAQVDEAVWAVGPGGQRYSGAAAINRTLEVLGGFWAWLGGLYHLAPVRRVEDAVYRWAARHRHWLSTWLGTTPECDRPGVECD